MTCRLGAAATEADVLALARLYPHETGRVTAVYCYADGAAVPVAIADAEDNAAVLAILNQAAYPAWRFVSMRYTDGNGETVDCAAFPQHRLCRQF